MTDWLSLVLEWSERNPTLFITALVCLVVLVGSVMVAVLCFTKGRTFTNGVTITARGKQP